MMLDFDELVKTHNIQTDGVLHIGASTGQEIPIYVRNKIRRMIFIEAIPEVYEKLKKNIENHPEAIAINECVGSSDGREVIFNISNNEGQSSSFLEFGTHKAIHPGVKFIDSFKTKTKKFETICQEYGIELGGTKLLNIDVQGAELHVLLGMGYLLNLFDYAILEINKRETYIGCPSVQVIDNYMIGFGLHRVETGKWVADTWTDGFYKRM